MGDAQQELQASCELILEYARDACAPELRPDIEDSADLVLGATDLLIACKACIAWFDELDAHQTRLLGKDFESACENWDEATDVKPLDLTAMREAVTKTKSAGEFLDLQPLNWRVTNPPA